MTPDASRPDVAGRLAASVRQSSQGNLQMLEFHAMSTVCRVQYWGVSNSVARGLQREVLERVGGFETRYSRFVGGSWMAQINAAAGQHWVATTDEDERLLDLCARHFTLSGGIFDVTALPLIQLWNWKQSPVALPDSAAIQAAQATVGCAGNCPPRVPRRDVGWRLFAGRLTTARSCGGITSGANRSGLGAKLAVGQLPSAQRRRRPGLEQGPPRPSYLLHGNFVLDSTRATIMKNIVLQNDGRKALWRITADSREQLLRLLFHRYPYREWGTFFRFGFRRTSWGILITHVDPIAPEPGDLDRRSAIVEFRPPTFNVR